MSITTQQLGGRVMRCPPLMKLMKPGIKLLLVVLMVVQLNLLLLLLIACYVKTQQHPLKHQHLLQPVVLLCLQLVMRIIYPPSDERIKNLKDCTKGKSKTKMENTIT